MTASLPSHPKIFQMGKLNELFDGEVVIEEKIDGSQFGFGLAADDGRLVFRSKGREIFADNVDAMFASTIASIQDREAKIRANIMPGVFLYGEALNSPKHNTLQYDRTPIGHVILFGGTDVNGDWISRDLLERLAVDLNLEVVPVLDRIKLTTDIAHRAPYVDRMKALVDGPSILGGKREGVVVKNYGQRVFYNGVMSPVFCKLVSADFKEKHNDSWTPAKDHLSELIEGYRSEARWDKAIQHLRDHGMLTDSPKDIGPLVKRVQDDLHEEEVDELAARLAAHFMPQVKRVAVHGLPEYYKDRLMTVTA